VAAEFGDRRCGSVVGHETTVASTIILAVEFLAEEWVAILVHIAVVAGAALRVVMLRPLPGVALAWILLVAALPVLGVILYLLMGERRLGARRASRLTLLRTKYSEWSEEILEDRVADVDWSRHSPLSRQVDTFAIRALGIPTLIGGDLELIDQPLSILRRIAADVDSATSSVHLEFYIWHVGGAADEVVRAAVRAAERGVCCRILVDSVGSKDWLSSEHPRALRAAGAEVVEALPVGAIRTITSRNDLRMHRKIVVIDGAIGWTGSMNLVDPRFFKRDAGVGEWIDAMVRVQGPPVELLAGIFLSDWQLETGEPPDELFAKSDMRHLEPVGNADVLVVPSGPGHYDDTILQLFLLGMYSARTEIVLTTPYFVPDEALLRALRSAAGRGVAVHLILPAKVDSLMVRYASRSYYQDLMECGVHIYHFGDGLLHTKSMTVDGRGSTFGTANFDMRSLWLNFEVSLIVFDAAFTGRLRQLQQSYIDRSELLDEAAWNRRGFAVRLVENTTRLFSPLL